MVSLLNGLGGAAGFGESYLARNDDGSTTFVDVTSVFQGGLNFFGTTYTGFYINNNGNLTFADPRSSFTPTSIVSLTNNPEISIFYADTDTRGGPVAATPGGTSTGSNLLWYDLDAANRSVTITWDDVGYFGSHTDKLNAFQIVLTDTSGLPGRSAGDFSIQFRYEDINWTTGDASNGVGGLGGTVARAGYSAGQGTAHSFFEIPLSGIQDEMLAIDTLSGNTGQAGLWQWEVTSGVVPTSLAIEAVQGTVNEGNTGTTEVQYRVVRSGDPTTDVTFTAFFAGTSANPIDSVDLDGMTVPSSAVFTMAAGESSMIITLPVRGDTQRESDEVAMVTIGDATASNGVPVVITQGQANVVIRNDDGLPPVIPPGWVIGRTAGDPHLVTLDGLAYDFQAAGEFILSESTAGTPFVVQIRTQPAPGSTVVSVTTAVATLVDGHRVTYDGLADTLRVDGVVVTIDPAVGNLALGTGAIYQTADGGFQVVYGDGAQALVFDDQGGFLDVSLALSPARAGQLRGLLGDFDGSTGDDLALRDGTVLAQPIAFGELYGSYANGWRISAAESLFDYAPGESTTSFTDLNFPQHSVTLADFPPALVAAARAQAAAAGITDPTQRDAAVLDYLLTGDTAYFESAAASPTPTATLPVSDAPPPPASLGIGIASPAADERNAGATPFTFTVYRTDATGTLEVNWTVSADQADGADFVGGTLPAGTLTFAEGQTEATLTIEVQGDAAPELDEGFTVSVSTAQAGVVVVAPRAHAVIRNDDGALPTTLSVVALDAALAEGDSGPTTFRFQVVRTGDVTGATTVDLTSGVAPGTSADAADLAGGFGTLSVSFAPGETHKVVTVQVQGDTMHEAAETFQATLGNAVGGSIGMATAVATILDDDPLPVISIAAAGPSLAEGNSGTTGFTFTLTRTGDLSSASSVQVASAATGLAGSADAADLVGGFGSQTVTFAAGEASRTVTFQVQGDTAVEGNEGFLVKLSSAVGATLGTVTATATILNDDASAPPPPPAGGMVRLTEGNDTVSYAASAGRVMVQMLGGDDRVTGSRYADALNGGSGNDAIDAGAGNDTITGGQGTDRMKGGEGNDTFIFNKGDLVGTAANGGYCDHIIDFHGAGGYKAYLGIEDDMITFSGFAAGSLVFNRNVGGDARVQLYDIFDGGLFQGNLLVQMVDGAAQLGAGDYRWL